MVLMGHVSELYATPVLMSVALLAGRAADGWLRAGRELRPRLRRRCARYSRRRLVWASWAKVEGVAEAGRQTDEHIQQILSHIPPHASGWRIAALFDPADPQPAYSVFAPWQGEWDIIWIQTLHWFRPGQELDLENLILPDAGDRANESFDLILKWDRPAARYRPLEDLAAYCRSR